MSTTVQKYKTITEDGSGEIVEKKSRFICNLYHIESEEEAAAKVAALKKEHYQARHVCFAYILGEKGDVFKYSDDGEPSGTAGRPMLEILKGRELTYTLCCVTRYFGGVLLGTGGLVRAYSDALCDGLNNTKVSLMELQKKITVRVDYNAHGKLKYALPDMGGVVVAEDFSDMVDVCIAFPVESEARIREYITELTGGKALVEDKGTDYVRVE